MNLGFVPEEMRQRGKPIGSETGGGPSRKNIVSNTLYTTANTQSELTSSEAYYDNKPVRINPHLFPPPVG